MIQNPILLWDIFIRSHRDFLNRVAVFAKSQYQFRVYFIELAKKCQDLDVKIFQSQSREEATRLFSDLVFTDLPLFEKCSENEMNDPFFQICECFMNFIKGFLSFASIVIKVNDRTTKLLDALAEIELVRKNREEKIIKEQKTTQDFLDSQRAKRMNAQSIEKYEVLNTSKPSISPLEKLSMKVHSEQVPKVPTPKSKNRTNLNPNAAEYFPQPFNRSPLAANSVANNTVVAPQTVRAEQIFVGPLNIVGPPSPRQYNIVFAPNVKNANRIMNF